MVHRQPTFVVVSNNNSNVARIDHVLHIVQFVTPVVFGGLSNVPPVQIGCEVPRIGLSQPSRPFVDACAAIFANRIKVIQSTFPSGSGSLRLLQTTTRNAVLLPPDDIVKDLLFLASCFAVSTLLYSHMLPIIIYYNQFVVLI
jgi:hypothetical protein